MSGDPLCLARVAIADRCVAVRDGDNERDINWQGQQLKL
jgi:hypothetical protein